MGAQGRKAKFHSTRRLTASPTDVVDVRTMQKREPFGGFWPQGLTCARNTASKDEAMELSQAISSILPGPSLCYLYPTCPVARPDSAVPARHLPIYPSRPSMNGKEKAAKAPYTSNPILEGRNYRVRTICSKNGVLTDILTVDPYLPRLVLGHELSLRPSNIPRATAS